MGDISSQKKQIPFDMVHTLHLFHRAIKCVSGAHRVWSTNDPVVRIYPETDVGENNIIRGDTYYDAEKQSE